MLINEHILMKLTTDTVEIIYQVMDTKHTVLSTCPLHTNSGCGKERRILISRILCTNDLIVLHLLGIFFSYFFLVRKIPSYRGSNSRPDVSEGYEVTN